MWVTSGASTTRVGTSSMPSSAPRPRLGSNRRWPSPSSTGAMCTSSWSSSPAVSTWRRSSPPPATATSLQPAASRASSMARSSPSVTNVKEVPPWRSTTSRGTVGDDEHRGAERRLLTPGDLAGVEHAPAHDIGTGRRERRLDDLRVDRLLAAGEALPLAPGHGVDGPAGDPEETGRFGAPHPATHVLRAPRVPG